METDKVSMRSADEVQALVTLWADSSVQDQLISAERNRKSMTQMRYKWTPTQC